MVPIALVLLAVTPAQQVDDRPSALAEALLARSYETDVAGVHHTYEWNLQFNLPKP